MSNNVIPPHPLPPHPEEPWDIDFGSPDCDDQLALFSKVGRGLRGSDFKVVIKSDAPGETYLEGLAYDPNTNEYSSEWVSQNINGGELMYQYNLRPYSVPQTFTITFRYKRPNRSSSEWIWTTPAIPYIWDADNDGLADVDGIIGVGVGTLFLKKTTDSQWVMSNLPTSHTMAQATSRQEKLLYPNGWTRDMFNAPKPGEPWTVNLQYGIGGDIDAPNIDDIAKLLGITVQQVRNIIAGQSGQFGGSDNVKDYVDDLKAHIHSDMGFGSSGNTQFIEDGGSSSSGKWSHPVAVTRGGTGSTTSTATTIKSYVDEGDQILRNRILNLEGEVDGLKNRLATAEGNITALQTTVNNLGSANSNLKNALQALVNKIVGGGTVNNDGTITWPSSSPLNNSNGGSIAAGTLNVYGGDNRAKWIKTHVNEANDDVWAR